MNKLVQGKYYYLPFVAPYTHKGPYKVEISAIARKSTLSFYGDFDIRSTFFDEVGIKTYLSMVTDETNIYICHEIKELEPPEVDAENYIFIPETIIDYSNVDQYVTANRIQINIEGIRRRFEHSYEMSDFIDEIESTIPVAINRETILANDLLSLSNSTSEHLVLLSEINKEEYNRDVAIEERNNEKTRLNVADSEREMDYYRRLSDVKRREKEVAENLVFYENSVKQAQLARYSASKIMEMSNDLMRYIEQMYALVQDQASLNGMSVPSWDNLVQMVFNDSGDNGIDPNRWNEILSSIKNMESIPDDLLKVDIGNCPVCGHSIDETALISDEQSIDTN